MPWRVMPRAMPKGGGNQSRTHPGPCPVRRLWYRLLRPPRESAALALWWSWWRRRHQARALQSHSRDAFRSSRFRWTVIQAAKSGSPPKRESSGNARRSHPAPTVARRGGSYGPDRRPLRRLFRRAGGRVLHHIRQQVPAARRTPQAGCGAGRVRRMRGPIRRTLRQSLRRDQDVRA